MRRLLSTLVLRLLGLFSPPRPGPLPQLRPQRIAVVRYGGLGDVVFATGLAASLRRRYPEAEIIFVTAAPAAPLLAHHPAIDRVAVVSPARLNASPGRLWRAIRDLRSVSPGVDIVFMTHTDLWTLALVPALRARYRVGFDERDRGYGFCLTHPVSLHPVNDLTSPVADRRHVNSFFHDLLRGFTGEAVPEEDQRLWIGEQERAEATAWLAERGAGPSPVVLLPCGSETLKLWPTQRYVEVARRLVAQGQRVVILGGPAESALQRDFAGLCVAGGGAVFAAGELPLRMALAVLAQACAVVGNDTGLVHAAAALGRPTLALFGPTPWWVYGYSGSRNRVASAALPCVPCARQRCALRPDAGDGAPPPCLDEIGVVQVVDEIRTLLAG